MAVTSAQYDYTGPQRVSDGSAKPVYGVPQREFEEQQQAQPLPPQQQPQPLPPQQSQQPQAEAYTPQVFKHIYVHAAEDEAPDQQSRVIKVPGGDKHVNIIFVKTPSQSSQAQTEVILPEQDEHKNLVYVLLKKNTAENNIRIRRPQAQQPQKPEVYFIRYKDQEQQQQNGASGGYSQSGQNGSGPSPVVQSAPIQSSAPTPVRSSPQVSNGGSSKYSEAGRYTPAFAPGPIRSASDVPSSGYGVPL